MKNNHKSRIARALALLLCLCLLCIPMLGMAAQADTSDNNGAEMINSSDEAALLSKRPGHGGDKPTDPDKPCDTDKPAPVCNCQTKCETGAPKTDCPVCSADVTGCTGKAPDPTPAPDPSYTISILHPSGWYTRTANVVMQITDVNKTGWKKVEARVERNGSWIDITDDLLSTDRASIEISENCTVYVTVTDKNGKAHSESRYIECFDREAPTVRAGIDGALLRVESGDDLSGVECVYVNGYRFSSLTNGTLDIRIKDYDDGYEKITVQAVDYAGNKSKTVQIKNPCYGQSDNHTSTTTPNTTPTTTPTPTLTPSTTSAPSSGNTGNTGNSGNSGTVKPSATPSATPNADTTPPPTTTQPGTSYSENGNAVTRDLLYDKYTNKQFIVVQTRGGETFYLVIDYDKPIDEDADLYETYFLNMVDERDLLDIIGEKDLPVSNEPVDQPTTEPESTDEPEPDTVDKPEPDKKGGIGGILLIVLILAAGGGALWYFKLRKPKQNVKGSTDLGDYDFEDEDEAEEYVTEDAAEQDVPKVEAADEGEADDE